MGRNLLLFSAGLLGRLARWSLTGLAILLWRFFSRIVRGASLLAFAGLLAMARGVPESTELIADEWSKIMLGWGLPQPTIDRLNPIFRVWGFILIFTGWIIIGLIVGLITILAT